MKKIIFVAFIALVAGCTLLFYSVRGDSRPIGTSSISELKTQLAFYNDSIDALDMSISELIRKQGREGGVSRLQDSLMARQQALRTKYEEIRRSLVLAAEDKFIPRIIATFTRMVKKAGWLYILLGIGFFLLMLTFLMFGKYFLAEPASEKKAPVRGPREKLKPLPDQAEDRFKSAVSGLAAITKRHNLDKIPLGKPEAPQSQQQEPEDDKLPYKAAAVPDDALELGPGSMIQEDLEEESVPVDHLDENRQQDPSQKAQIKKEPPLELTEKLVELKNVFPEKNHEISAFEQEPTPPSEESGWELYEQEEKQKATVVRLARRGSTSSEISKRLKISQDEVELLIRANRDRY